MSQRREPETSLFVLIARRMEPERSGSSSQRPLGLSSRVAFCYLRSVLPVSSNGRLSARLPETDGSHPVPQGSATLLSSKLATPSISELIKHCKDAYLRLPRRRWTASFECAALAMIFPSPANLAAAFEDAPSKLGLVDRKDPRDDDSGEVDHRGAKRGARSQVTRGRL